MNPEFRKKRWPLTQFFNKQPKNQMNAKDYTEINQLIEELSLMTNELEIVEGNAKTLQLKAADHLLPRHSELKVKITSLEERIKKLTTAHYDELFPKEKRSHKTPFGELSFRRSAELEYEDEEKVILKIEAACAKEAERAGKAKETPRFSTDQIIRMHKTPNLEALESFDDVTLSLFGIKRTPKENFSVKPFAMKTDKPAKRKESA